MWESVMLRMSWSQIQANSSFSLSLLFKKCRISGSYHFVCHDGG